MMKINNVIVNECVGNEMKFFVKEGNVEDVENRWFSWSEVIEMVLEFKFEKGVGYEIYLGDRGSKIEEVEEGFEFEEMIEGGGEKFYEDEKVKLGLFEECIFVMVK